MKILLVEDNDETAGFILSGLQEAGHYTHREAHAQKGLLAASTESFDVIIFDRLLPGMEGTDAIRILRQSGIQTPIILLTALSGVEDRVRGLDAGADDYLVKPFAFSELYARLRALARRQPVTEQQTRIEIHDLIIERTTQTVSRGGENLMLSPREYRILDYLAEHEGQLVTRTMLLEKIWNLNFDPHTNLVQTHLSRLRTKVDKPYPVKLIQTVRGSGYIIAAPGQVS